MRKQPRRPDQVIVYTSAGGRMALRPFTEVFGRNDCRIAVGGIGEQWWPSVLGCDFNRPGVYLPDDTAALAWLLEGEVGR